MGFSAGGHGPVLRTTGTRMNSPSVARSLEAPSEAITGALASTASLGRDGAARSSRDTFTKSSTWEVYVWTSNAKSVVQRITKTEEPFPNFTFDSEAGKSAERTLKINFDFISPDQSIGSMMGRYMAMTMTLGVVSFCSPNKVVLAAEVLAADGTMLRTYRYSKKIRASMSSACAPATDQTHPKLVADMLRKLFRQIKKDKVI